ncbi:MAG: FKBP-type peptidyl-prolyl cis-trans isomerase FkpA [Paraglaciecola sp.]|jgi:FKBP-type peptidyl-prolyl cis-trans isomerase FkpA
MPFVLLAADVFAGLSMFWRIIMKKTAIAILVTSALGLSACQQDPIDPMKVETVVLETEEHKQAYAMGAVAGQHFAKQLAAQAEIGMVHDKTLVVKGFTAALQQQSQLEAEEIQSIMQVMQNEVRTMQQAKAAEVGEANKATGADYLAENAKREGVTVTESGLQYEVVTPGEGAKPAVSDTVKVHYRGTLLDGTEFDSSYSRNKPAVFPLTGVIAGWTEGVQLMPVGSTFKFHIPSELAYGARSTGNISAHSTLVFDVELLEIVTADNKTAK